MTEVIARGLVARRLRAALTALAIVLGVAMISGTYILSDTVLRAYAGIFTTAYVHTDAVVVAKAPFGVTGASKQPVPAAWLERIRALPEVGRAHGYIDARAELIDRGGTTIGGSNETLLFGIPTGELDAMNPLRLVSGRWPSGASEVVVDEATATKNHLLAGARVGIVARAPLARYRVVGTVRFGGVTTLGPTQLLAVDIRVAQRILDKSGRFDEIDVAARPGVSASSLVGAIRRALPATATVNTSARQASEATSEVAREIDLLRYVLLAFAGIALFVGSFIIFNTLSITVAQRARELATLATIGASRRQILASILLEGAILGLVASLIGIAAGIGVAKALGALLAAGGVKLPTVGLVLSARTLVVGVGVGVGVTLAASVAPALRANRVPPILALREGSSSPSRTPTATIAIVLTSVVGLALLLTAAVVGGLPTTTRLLLLACGALVLFVAVAGASRWLVPALASVIERPIEPFAGSAGELARENAVRMPERTSTTASALTVGVALVAFVAILAQGLRDATGAAIRQQVTAGYVVTASRDLLPPEVQQALAGAGLQAAGVRVGTVHAFAANETISGVSPAAIARFYRFRWTAGSTVTDLAALDASGVLVTSDFAAARHLARGARVELQTTSGTTLHLVVRGVYVAPELQPLLGAITITTALFDQSFAAPGDGEVFIDSAAPATPTAEQAIASALKGFPTVQVHSFPAFVASRQAAIGDVLDLLFVLLALSIVISLLGIVNTLTLSVAERTREIGLLRAIGMTRAQVARMIRIESAIIALIGATIGILVGVALAALTAQVLSAWSVGLSIPWTTLAIVLAGALVAGGAAGIAPARRAAHLDPLTALSYE